jgi:hypothetical protein
MPTDLSSTLPSLCFMHRPQNVEGFRKTIVEGASLPLLKR